MLRVPIRLLVPVAVLSLAGLFTAAMKVPLYTDEIAYHLTQSRAWVENGTYGNLYPQCFPPGAVLGSSWLLQAPKMVGRLLYSWMSSPIQLRLAGVALLASNILLLFLNLRRLLASPTSAAIVTLAVVGTGVTALNWSIHRPEGWLTFITQLLIRCIISGGRDASSLKQKLVLLTIPVAAAMAAAVHANSLYLTPIFLAAIVIQPVPRLWKLAAIILIAWITHARMDMSAAVMACREDPALSALLNSYVLRPGIAWTRPLDFIDQAMTNVIGSSSYLSALLYQRTYPYGWLPQSGLLPIERILNGVTVLAWITTLLCIRPWTAKSPFRSAPDSQPWIFGFGASVLIVAALQSLKLFYSSQLFVILVIYLLAFWQSQDAGSQITSRQRWALVFVTTAIAANSCWTMLKSAVAPAWTTQAMEFQSVQGLTVPTESYSRHVGTIETLAQSCGLFPYSELRNVVVDDLTYWHFRKSKQPLHAFYVGRSSYSRSIRDLETFLITRGSSGVLTRCWELDAHPTLLARATRLGLFCCIKL